MQPTKSTLLAVAFGLASFTAALAGSTESVTPHKTCGSTCQEPSTFTPTGWEVTGAVGASMADGNSESLAYSAQLLAARYGERDETFLGADYFYSDNKGIETTNSLRAYAQQNRLLSERFYVGGAANYMNDRVANIDSRIDLNLLMGYYLIKNEATKLALEAGPGYTFENIGGMKDDYPTLRFAEKFSHRFNSRSKIWQNAIYTPAFDDMSDYLLTLELGMDTQLTNNWALRTFARHTIDSTPAAGFEKGDTSLMVGLAYSLAGFPEPAAAGRRTLKAARKPKTAAAMGWTSVANAGYTMSQGNSDNSLLSVGIDSAHRTTADELFLNANSAWAQNNGSTSISNIRGLVQYNRFLSEMTYVGAGISYLRDQIADVSYRFTPAMVAGMYLVKNETIALSVEAGPGYTFEKVGGIKDDYLTVQAAERLTWAVSDRCNIGQTCVYNGEAADLGQNFLITSTAFLDTDITDSLAWRVAGSYVYDNTPANNLERHDTTMTTGIAVSF